MMVQGVSINEMLDQSIQVLTKPGVETFERFERHGGQREATIYHDRSSDQRCSGAGLRASGRYRTSAAWRGFWLCPSGGWFLHFRLSG